jgi:ubiquinone/menaquinone biosynthesis C-methylase UbiE
MEDRNTKANERKQCGCGGTVSRKESEENAAEVDVRAGVRKAYAQVAKRSAGSCCAQSGSVTSEAGYNEEELGSLPDTAVSVSAGCGNPTAIAELKPGEVVLDLGSGGGIDVFLAGKRVGPMGKAIGVDMTPEMIETARRNARKSGLNNVEFRLGEIEHLPVPDESVDVIISNCVINLSPEKDEVFKEAYRVLKKGGRMQVSDMMASGIPDIMKKDISLWASCVGGAIELEEYLNKIKAAGFSEVRVVKEEEYSKDLIQSSLESMVQTTSEKEEQRKLKKVADFSKQNKDKLNVRISHADILAVKN